MTRLQRVFIDTSELYPFTIMDVLLTMSEDFLFTWVWTEEVLDEWERVIIENGVRSMASARSVTNAVRVHFDRYRLDPDLYRDKSTADLSTDPGDRIHVAACVFGDVDILLTRDATGFKAAVLEASNVQVANSDEFLCTLLERHPRAVTESLTRAATSRKSPPVSATELANKIAKAGAPRFAAQVRKHLS